MITQLDEYPNQNNLLELVVLVMQHWIKEMIDRDPFILNNTIMILEMLVKSFTFTSKFKNRDCVEKLIATSKAPQLSSSLKNQIIRICHALSSTTSLNVLKYYEL